MSDATMKQHLAAITETAAYLTARELAHIVRVSEPTIFRWASEDPTMPALRVGRTIRFPRARVERWLAQREQGRGRAR